MMNIQRPSAFGSCVAFVVPFSRYLRFGKWQLNNTFIKGKSRLIKPPGLLYETCELSQTPIDGSISVGFFPHKHHPLSPIKLRTLLSHKGVFRGWFMGALL